MAKQKKIERPRRGRQLPPHGVPYGGWQNYRDCKPGMPVMCLRPDCGRCDIGLAAQRKAIIDSFESEITRLRSELEKARAVVEPLERLLAWKPGYPVMIRKLSYSHRVDIGPCKFEAYKLGETLLLAATNVK